MEKPPAPPPKLKAGPMLNARALADKRAREAREAAALRANLLRRKAQARSRGTPAPGEQAPAPAADADREH